MMKLCKKGQSLIEYSILIIIILGAFVAMGHYFKRGVQGRWRAAIDDLGEQYDPRVANSDYTVSLNSSTTTIIRAYNTEGGWWTFREDSTNSDETKSGYQSIGAY